MGRRVPKKTATSATPTPVLTVHSGSDWSSSDITISVTKGEHHALSALQELKAALAQTPLPPEAKKALDELEAALAEYEMAEPDTTKPSMSSADMSKAVDPKLTEAREARSKKYGIPALEDGALTQPAGYPESEDAYGDPVNYAYPVDTADRAKNAAARFSQYRSAYPEGAQKTVFARIVEAEVKFGAAPEPSEDLRKLLSPELLQKLDAVKKSVGDSAKVEKGTFATFMPFRKTAIMLEGRIRGVVYPADKKDAHGELASAEDLRKAAHLWMEDSREVNLHHSDKVVTKGVRVVESFIAPTALPEIGANPGDWIAEFAVRDDVVRKEIENGKIRGFSIEGVCDKIRDVTRNVVKMVNLMVTRISLVGEPASMIDFVAKSQIPPSEVITIMETLKKSLDVIQGQTVELAKSLGVTLPADIPNFSLAKSEEEMRIQLLNRQAGYVSEVMKGVVIAQKDQKDKLAKALETGTALADVVEKQKAHITQLERHPDIAKEIALALNGTK